ncbi:MAG: tetratricopeptide repeat protein [Leptolyngbyaceae cyanobacterium]
MANPLNSSAWNNLGYQLFSLSHYIEALAAYNHALLIDPDYSLSLANRCAVLSKMGEYVQALESCQRAIAKDHRWGNQGPALAWDNQGDVLFNLQLYQEALKSFEQAIALNPDDLNAQRNWLIVQHQLSEISKETALEQTQGDDDA